MYVVSKKTPICNTVVSYWLIENNDIYMHASLNQVRVGSDNGLAPNRRQAIIWTNADLLLIDPLGTNSVTFEYEYNNFHL